MGQGQGGEQPVGPFIEAEACCDVGKTKSGAWRVQSSVLCRGLVLWALGPQTVEASVICMSYGWGLC